MGKIIRLPIFFTKRMGSRVKIKKRLFEQVDIFVTVACQREEMFELRAGDDDRCAAVVRMETEAFALLQGTVQEEMYMVFLIVDQTEW